MLRRTLPLLFVMLTIAPTLQAEQRKKPRATGILTFLSPAEIQEAIDLGKREREARQFLARYDLGGGSVVFVGTIRRFGFFSTPYSRVVAVSLDATLNYQAITPGDIDTDLLVPEVRVLAWSAQKEKDAAATAAIANVSTIVLMPKGTKDRSRAVQPIRRDTSEELHRNLFGATFEGAGMLAVFPIDQFRSDHTIRVVYDGDAPMLNSITCRDCAFDIPKKGIQ